MGRVRAKKKKTVEPAPGTRSRAAVDLEDLRQEIRNLIGNGAIGMVEKTMDQADKGHYQAMKFLFEMAGLYPVNGPEEEHEGADVLADTLLRRLGVEEGLLAAEIPDIKDDSEGDVK